MGEIPNLPLGGYAAILSLCHCCACFVCSCLVLIAAWYPSFSPRTVSQFQTEAEREQWLRVLSVVTQESKSFFSSDFMLSRAAEATGTGGGAVSHSQTPRTEAVPAPTDNSNPAELYMAHAFYAAYRDVRLRYGLCGSFKVAGSEGRPFNDLRSR